MKATWSYDLDSSSSDEEEHVVNMGFMEIKSENEVQYLDNESDLITYDEFYNAFGSLFNEFEKLD